MKQAITWMLAVLLFGVVAGQAADNGVVGKWDCVSSDDAGQEYTWTLIVKDDGGKLSGTLTGGPGEFDLVEPKLDGNTFTFKISINADVYEIKSTLDGGKLEGKYRGPESTGQFKGTKQS